MGMDTPPSVVAPAAQEGDGIDQRIGLPQHECRVCHGLDKPMLPICDKCYRNLYESLVSPKAGVTVTEEMVERAAKAKHQSENNARWEDAYDSVKNDYRNQVRPLLVAAFT